jgi:transcriptional regulator with XRE-family HTH domain
MTNNFAQRLKEARAKAGLRQQDLAEALGGKTKGAIGAWETGTARPNIDDLVRISEVLNVSPSWLLEEQETIIAPKMTYNLSYVVALLDHLKQTRRNASETELELTRDILKHCLTIVEGRLSEMKGE